MKDMKIFTTIFCLAIFFLFSSQLILLNAQSTFNIATIATSNPNISLTSLSIQISNLSMKPASNGCWGLSQNPQKAEILMLINYTKLQAPCALYDLNLYGQGSLNKYNINLNLTNFSDTAKIAWINSDTENGIVAIGPILNISHVLLRLERRSIISTTSNSIIKSIPSNQISSNSVNSVQSLSNSNSIKIINSTVQSNSLTSINESNGSIYNSGLSLLSTWVRLRTYAPNGVMPGVSFKSNN